MWIKQYDCKTGETKIFEVPDEYVPPVEPAEPTEQEQLAEAARILLGEAD